MMNFKDLMKWNSRVSALYAVGIWTMLGSYAYFRHTGRYTDPEVSKEIEDIEEPNKQIYQTAHSKTVIIYKNKEDFVPYSTRIYSFIKSLTGGPGDGTQ
ncbi:small integral membrane protein 26-like [Cyprinodon tularosa]|uniref:small integral membrane protein 26-like n=1 Tax=Cyprinodon tularosa TaxID=77115 RepID=UPI0018E28180|nr:small integral membrane protein 26-like [Cyprinodon tularosa]